MSRAVKSETIGARLDLASLCNALGLWRAVEVGTDRGVFASDFLDRWRGEMLYCVDPYEPYNEMPWDRRADLMMAVGVLQRHARRSKIVIATSEDAAKYLMPAIRFGMVYIDGDHAYQATRKDIELWWPRVQPGGILAGHDYDEVNHPGVIRAVDEFAYPEGLEVRLTTDHNQPLSWYVHKPLEPR